MADVFRSTHRKLTEKEKASVEAIKARARELYAELSEPVNDQRCMALAKTKLEEAVMWAVKGITG